MNYVANFIVHGQPVSPLAQGHIIFPLTPVYCQLREKIHHQESISLNLWESCKQILRTSLRSVARHLMERLQILVDHAISAFIPYHHNHIPVPELTPVIWYVIHWREKSIVKPFHFWHIVQVRANLLEGYLLNSMLQIEWKSLMQFSLIQERLLWPSLSTLWFEDALILRRLEPIAKYNANDGNHSASACQFWNIPPQKASLLKTKTQKPPNKQTHTHNRGRQKKMNALKRPSTIANTPVMVMMLH